MAIDGTSATTILLDKETGDTLAAAELYHEEQPAQVVARAKVVMTALEATQRVAALNDAHQGHDNSSLALLAYSLRVSYLINSFIVLL